MLSYRLREARTHDEKPPALILMHGIGGNEDMLSFLASRIAPGFLVFQLRAPYRLSENKYSWFGVDFSESKISVNPEEVRQSIDEVISFIGYAKSTYRFDPSRIFIGGFSQGGEMAYYTALSRPELFKGLIIFSSRIAPEMQDVFEVKEIGSNLQAFIYHGSKDPVIKVDEARASVAFLHKLGLAPHYRETTDKHLINTRIFEELNEWLNPQ